MSVSLAPLKIAGFLSDISVASDGTVWGVNSAGDIYKYVGGTAPWKPVPGALKVVAVGAAANTWGLNAAGDIYKYVGGSTGWEKIAGVLSDISVASDGTVWGVNRAGDIYKYAGGTAGWQQVPGALKTVAVGSATNIWGVNSAGGIYKYAGGSVGWEKIPGVLSDISVASDGTVWGVNSSGDIFNYVGGTAAWQQVPGALKIIAVGSATNVWALDSAGDIYEYVPAVPEPPGGYIGSANYVLANGSNCTTLTGVRATIRVTEDLVWQSSQGPGGPGFSIQLNAEMNSNKPLDWQQFVVHMGDDQGLWPWINIWQPSSPGQAGSPSILWNQQVANPVANMPQAARIPAGYSIVIALENDSEGRVTGTTWNVLDGSNKSLGSVSYALSNTAGGGVPPDDLSAIASFQVTFGGGDDGGHATFSSGAGVVVLQADQPMNVSGSYPGCIGFIGGTAETSNIAYGELPAIPSTTFSQAFSVKPDSATAHMAKPGARKLPLARVAVTL
jgi:virginiamycin B lyase